MILTKPPIWTGFSPNQMAVQLSSRQQDPSPVPSAFLKNQSHSDIEIQSKNVTGFCRIHWWFPMDCGFESRMRLGIYHANVIDCNCFFKNATGSCRITSQNQVLSGSLIVVRFYHFLMFGGCPGWRQPNGQVEMRRDSTESHDKMGFGFGAGQIRMKYCHGFGYS